MRVEKIMTRDPLTCTPDEHAGTAAWRMWNGDCGILPVVRDGRLVGVLTDRDIAVALALRGGRAQDLRIGEIQQGGEALVACGPPPPTA
ncbi:MAG TPA: CBS domain-containing protein [Longimicrobiales bacterium]|nr:CBS domain-containing protein [Longimicrobiales bacterium]